MLTQKEFAAMPLPVQVMSEVNIPNEVCLVECDYVPIFEEAHIAFPVDSPAQLAASAITRLAPQM